jgi:hypothetical protein
MPQDPSVVFENDRAPSAPATHVLIIGVGKYDFGRDKGASLVAGDLAQLSSPPISARAVANWFMTEFENTDRPLASVAMLLSEPTPSVFHTAEGRTVDVPAANLQNTKSAMRHWAGRIGAHPSNMAVFYFCGHGISLGQRAALLLSDFGDPEDTYSGAIDFDKLRGTLKNSAADQQLFLLDCCRTKADQLYAHETDIGSRVLSVPPGSRPQGGTPKQCVLLPTIEGEEAFGRRDRESVFAASFLDAVRFAAPLDETGQWISTTSLILNAVDRLIQYRLPEAVRRKSVPNALEATNFEFNTIPAPTKTRTFVTIRDAERWPTTELACSRVDDGGEREVKRAGESEELACCVFDLGHGLWRFEARLDHEPPKVRATERTLNRPVTYIQLEVEP